MFNFLLAVYRWLDENIEKSVSVTAYAFCAGIIAVEVFRRYAFGLQAPWSTYVPSYMFLWLTWLGASYCTKRRSHLVFNELRDRVSRNLQYALLQFDYLMYVVFGVIVIYWSFDLVALHHEMESIVPGTDDVMSWWFYSATPVGWVLLLFRVGQNVIEDFKDYRSGADIRIRGASMISAQETTT
jgi:TRAP-type C4-dicarboxylate transport system permease small subunit